MSSYFEEYALTPTQFQTQLASLVLSGVFCRWPKLRVTVLESGWTWLSGFLWRLDAEWKQYKRETPWLEAPPSEYVRRHFRFTTQPFDAPPELAQARELLDELAAVGSDPAEWLMYSSDYPHRYSADCEPLWQSLDADQRVRVMWRNAAEWYRVERRDVEGS
jgi:predicted TIM-barrel fold metal-dependent hydrolase